MITESLGDNPKIAIQQVWTTSFNGIFMEKTIIPKKQSNEKIQVEFDARLLTNSTHYGDPKNGCESDEQGVQIQGVSGDFCSPKCDNGSCPTDLPAGTTATPQCALQTPTGDK